MDALTGDEVCVRPATGSLTINTLEANLLRRVLADHAGRCMLRGRVDDTVDTLVLSRKIGAFEIGLREIESLVPGVADECMAWLEAQR
jgi:hypothetical protein